ncbi:MAG: PLDc N-terminal domain-containing protein [Geobacter sp.]|nr:PLDc N-terminal domain-containing protein [Geobacter sp.]
MFGFGMPEVIVLLVSMFALVPLAIIIWALVDILKSEFTGNNKIVWLLLVIFIPLLGVILYWFIGRGQKIKVISNL